MTQASHSDDTDTAARADIPCPQGRVCRDAGAKQRSGFRQVQTVRYSQDKFFPDDEMFGIAAVSDLMCDSVIGAVCPGHAFAA